MCFGAVRLAIFSQIEALANTDHHRTELRGFLAKKNKAEGSYKKRAVEESRAAFF